MTDGDAARTVPWVKKLGVRYAFAYDRQSYAFRAGVEAYPHAMLISPAGVILWRGHPEKLTTAFLKRHLTGTLKRPLWKWSQPLKTLIATDRWGEALTLAEATAATQKNTSRILRDVRNLLTGRIQSIRDLWAAGDVWHAWRRLHTLRDSLAGRAERSPLDHLLKSMNADPKVLDVYKRQARFRELRSRSIRTAKEGREVAAALERLEAEAPGTLVARQSAIHREFIARIQKMGVLH